MGGWDAIIVGASFGGLAAALPLAGAGRVLMIDRGPVGSGQTSACAAPLPLLRRLNALDAVEQVHPHCVMHLPGQERGHPFPMRHPWATFDYARLCRLLFERTGAEFEQATVSGLDGTDGVLTSLGERRARTIVDASGWRAVLGRRRAEAPVPESMGLEARLPGGGEGLHFWIRPPAIRHGYAWDFPAGRHRRAGVISYRESGGLRQRLDRFLGESPPAADLHGGGLPARLRDPVPAGVFAVGDAAGQCLPLTGEGIRPAFVFGHAAGRLVREVLAGRATLARALRAYRRIVRSCRLGYETLGALQAGLGHLPARSVAPLGWLLDRTPLRWPAEEMYWAAAPLELLAEAGRPRSGVRS